MLNRIFLVAALLAPLAARPVSAQTPDPAPPTGRSPLLAQASDLFAATVASSSAPVPASTPGADPGASNIPPQPAAIDWAAEGRACEGCPRRSVGKALLHATIINAFYETANLVRGQVTAKITPKTWWANMEQGWVWDLDDFLVNQIGHPYQGSNYFNAGRSNGLGFYESAAVAAFGSGTWEYYGETNFPSLNDFVNTTLGGIALGEMFHRAGWLVRNTRATGRGRLWSEIGAAVLDPITGVNRFISGDASRVSDRPADLTPSRVSGVASAGALWRGSQSRAIDEPGDPFLEVDALYGDPKTGSSRTPYDAFSVRLRFGGGAGFSEAKVRGRLAGVRVKSDQLHFNVIQSYDFQSNDAYSTGAQSFEGAFSWVKPLSPRTTMWLFAWGGATVLGAVDSLPPDVTEKPQDEEESDAGQGVSEGPRYYDYGPGGNFGATVEFSRGGRAFSIVSYEGRHLFSLDGVRANHFLQRWRVDLLVPVRRQLGIGASGEYFIRNTYYQDAARTIREYHYPQLRAYFTWSLS